jgi:thermitase
MLRRVLVQGLVSWALPLWGVAQVSQPALSELSAKVSPEAVLPPVRLLVGLLETVTPAGGLPGQTSQAADTRFARLNRQYAAIRVQSLTPVTSGTARAIYVVELPAGTDAQQAVRAYQQTGLFRYVELDGMGHGGGSLGTSPSDTQYGRQWGLRNNGVFPLTAARAGADIKMEDAWTISKGDSSITVAIIDSGCKLDHPDLAGRIWRNRREIAGNGIDDDHNGYVDDVSGWNFVSETNDPSDDYGHGTNVTGIVGANGNNSLGYAGVNWGCKLLICKGLNSSSNGYYSWWASAIYYAVANGARVINMSEGGTATSQTLQDAVTYATQHGVVVVACMMNENSGVFNYPAGLTGVIAVGATTPVDTRAVPFPWSATSGSNFGPHLTLVAPGNYIYGLHYLSPTNYATYWSGTSQATPYVAGVVSLLLTLQPQLTPSQVKTILQQTADDQVGNPVEDVAGWDPYYGFGRLNAARALQAAQALPTRLAQASVNKWQLYPNPARESLTFTTTDATLLTRELAVVNSVGQLVYRRAVSNLSESFALALPPGVYWVTVAGSAGGRSLVVQ